MFVFCTVTLVCLIDECMDDFTLAVVRPDMDKPNPKCGIGLVEWSSDGRYLAFRQGKISCNAAFRIRYLPPIALSHSI